MKNIIIFLLFCISKQVAFASEISCFDQLPAEIIQHTFSFLSPKEAYRASAVCKGWKENIDKHYFVKPEVIFPKEFGDYFRKSIPVNQVPMQSTECFMLRNEDKDDIFTQKDCDIIFSDQNIRLYYRSVRDALLELQSAQKPKWLEKTKHYYKWSEGKRKYDFWSFVNLDCGFFESFPPSLYFIADTTTGIFWRSGKLRILPHWFGNYKKLKTLMLNRNKLTFLPSIIGDLQDLEILDLRGNNLTDLPEELLKLNNLKYLNVCGNKFTTYPCVLTQLRKKGVTVDLKEKFHITDQGRVTNLSHHEESTEEVFLEENLETSNSDVEKLLKDVAPVLQSTPYQPLDLVLPAADQKPVVKEEEKTEAEDAAAAKRTAAKPPISPFTNKVLWGLGIGTGVVAAVGAVGTAIYHFFFKGKAAEKTPEEVLNELNPTQSEKAVPTIQVVR